MYKTVWPCFTHRDCALVLTVQPTLKQMTAQGRDHFRRDVTFYFPGLLTSGGSRGFLGFHGTPSLNQCRWLHYNYYIS